MHGKGLSVNRNCLKAFRYSLWAFRNSSEAFRYKLLTDRKHVKAYGRGKLSFCNILLMHEMGQNALLNNIP